MLLNKENKQNQTRTYLTNQYIFSSLFYLIKIELQLVLIEICKKKNLISSQRNNHLMCIYTYDMQIMDEQSQASEFGPKSS